MKKINGAVINRAYAQYLLGMLSAYPDDKSVVSGAPMEGLLLWAYLLGAKDRYGRPTPRGRMDFGILLVEQWSELDLRDLSTHVGQQRAEVAGIAPIPQRLVDLIDESLKQPGAE